MANSPNADGEQSQAQRYSPRVFVGARMTNVDRPRDKEMVKNDTGMIVEAVRMVASECPEPWETFCAPDEVPLEGQASALEVFEINWEMIAISDAFVIHGFDGGSIALGWELEAALNAPTRPPALLVGYETEVISKAVTGRVVLWPAFEIRRFNREMHLVHQVRSWLNQERHRIITGPARRREVEQQWKDRTEALRDSWRAKSEDTRQRVARALQLGIAAIDRILLEPILLAAMPAHVYSSLQDELLLDSLAEAREVLRPKELRAWQRWRQHRRRDHAERVLMAAVREHRREEIGRGASLDQPGGWEDFEQRYLRGDIP